ncbi:hypothetical protein [Natronorubrum halophilum]|uniref:hypothetical protein n=1 Tax=Natronorubrum halophilum TaxID=1702106 RepID=UPI000EF69A76
MIELVHSVMAELLVVQVDPGVDIGTTGGLVGSAIGSFLTTLVVGAIMVAVAPEYTERMMADVLEDPVNAFVYGILSLIGLFVLTLLLVITIVGIIVAIPLAIVAYLVGAIGSVIAYLAIADRLVGREDGWLKPLLVAAGLSGALALTGIGGLLSLCIAAAGFGAVLRDYLD